MEDCCMLSILLGYSGLSGVTAGQGGYSFHSFFRAISWPRQSRLPSLVSRLRYSACAIGRARAPLVEYCCACAMRTKWRPGRPEMPVEFSVSLFDSLTSLFVAKDQARLVLE